MEHFRFERRRRLIWFDIIEKSPFFLCLQGSSYLYGFSYSCSAWMRLSDKFDRCMCVFAYGRP